MGNGAQPAKATDSRMDRETGTYPLASDRDGIYVGATRVPPLIEPKGEHRGAGVLPVRIHLNGVKGTPCADSIGTCSIGSVFLRDDSRASNPLS